MPPPKKAAKNTPARPATKHDEAKDLRRAREHGGRLEVLRPLLGKSATPVDLLVHLAEQELAGAHPKDAADLLRAAEHLSFGHLVSSKPYEHIHPALSSSIEVEFEHKMEKAAEHWEESDALSSVHEKVVDDAKKAFGNGAYPKALELSRAAEAIAHVHLHAAEES